MSQSFCARFEINFKLGGKTSFGSCRFRVRVRCPCLKLDLPVKRKLLSDVPVRHDATYGDQQMKRICKFMMAGSNTEFPFRAVSRCEAHYTLRVSNRQCLCLTLNHELLQVQTADSSRPHTRTAGCYSSAGVRSAGRGD